MATPRPESSPAPTATWRATASPARSTTWPTPPVSASPETPDSAGSEEEEEMEDEKKHLIDDQTTDLSHFELIQQQSRSR